jgi:hypothetical protein
LADRLARGLRHKTQLTIYSQLESLAESIIARVGTQEFTVFSLVDGAESRNRSLR